MSSQPDPSFWKAKTVLVTGSSGFAGAYLSERLYELGAKVRCFIRSGENPPVSGPRAKTIVGDVQDYKSLLEALKGVDVAFHLAAITSVSEASSNIFNTFATNSWNPEFSESCKREEHQQTRLRKQAALKDQFRKPSTRLRRYPV